MQNWIGSYKEEILVTKLVIILALVGLLAGPAIAGEPNLESCRYWNTLDNQIKTAFVFGWARGVKAAAILTDAIIKEVAGSDLNFKMGPIIDRTLWPSGLRRMGSMVIEIDTECKKPENHNEVLPEVIVNISSRITNPK